MKRRVTYITAADAEFDPSKQAILSRDTLSIRGLDAAKEERFTFTSTELLTEVSINRFKTYFHGIDKLTAVCASVESSF
jgi:hypothetical protein